jgi:heat shock protein HslJ
MASELHERLRPSGRDPHARPFNPEGRISGNGGCNQFFGAHSISGTIKIGPLVSTRKGCPGLHAETAFFATLEAAKSFAQEGDNLVLFDAAGAKLAQFVRAG